MYFTRNHPPARAGKRSSMKRIHVLRHIALLAAALAACPPGVCSAAGPEGRNPDNHFIPATVVPATQNSADFTMVSTYSVPACNAGYSDTGLTMTISPAGTYLVCYQVRSAINASTTAGAALRTELYNVTDGAAVPYSQQIGAYASAIGQQFYGTATVCKKLTLSGPKVINLYADCIGSGTIPTKLILSDSNGWTGSYFVQLY